MFWNPFVFHLTQYALTAINQFYGFVNQTRFLMGSLTHVRAVCIMYVCLHQAAIAAQCRMDERDIRGRASAVT